MAAAGKLSSLILWGPPGSGKTTLAQILAQSAGAVCVHFSAVTSGVKDLKKIIHEAEQHQRLVRLAEDALGTIGISGAPRHHAASPTRLP